MSAVVVLITADPASSGKANEALREGLGFAASGLEVRLVLAGPAVKMLTDDPFDFVDGETIEKNLGFYRKWKTPILCLGGSPAGSDLNVSAGTPEGAAKLLAETDRLVRF